MTAALPSESARRAELLEKLLRKRRQEQQSNDQIVAQPIQVGTQTTELYNDAQAMLDKLIAEKWLTAKGVIGFWPAAQVGDDIEVYAETGTMKRKPVATLRNLRQQVDKPVESEVTE